MSTPVRYILAGFILALIIGLAIAGFHGLWNPAGIFLLIGAGIYGIVKLLDPGSPPDKKSAPGT
ncbi:hypothetical protein Acor_68970 [Acrocarpospora corrugata]|uniref:Uncharacterized protein n=1 Tax=Acrocarpospora corrugata TaxID=35763 RepID=A0A5M3W912_9ACTN|nr:hypothetical protein [Acrocarpospora corrugata]GES04829.1 hypothetical protein Acor_68970 [Acrocarpospora corrugata]